jgi:ubiquinone/menaquinone biosynthesis C-methylase UbiE
LSELGSDDRNDIIDRYVARLNQHGDDLRTLNVGDVEKYHRQHAVHAAIGPLAGSTVLDVGCGLGHFYEYLRRRCDTVRYVGYDMVEKFIAANREKFPQATFRVADVTRDPIPDRCDYAVMCQVFNNRYKNSDNLEIVRAVLAKTFEHADKAVSVDMLSTYVSYRDEHLYYYSPEEMFSFARTLTPYVSLLHGYLPHHFTLQLFKTPVQL